MDWLEPDDFRHPVPGDLCHGDRLIVVGEPVNYAAARGAGVGPLP